MKIYNEQLGTSIANEVNEAFDWSAVRVSQGNAAQATFNSMAQRKSETLATVPDDDRDEVLQHAWNTFQAIRDFSGED